MTKTNTLLAQLREANPTLTFDTMPKAESAYVDDEEYVDELIGVVVDYFFIVDPTTSTCGRFDVDPVDAYGIPQHVTDAMMNHNKPSGLLTQSSTPV